MSGSNQEVTKSKSLYPKNPEMKTGSKRRNHAIFLTLRDWIASQLRMNVDFGKEKPFERDTNSYLINFEMTVGKPGEKSLIDVGLYFQQVGNSSTAGDFCRKVWLLARVQHPSISGWSKSLWWVLLFRNHSTQKWEWGSCNGMHKLSSLKASLPSLVPFFMVNVLVIFTFFSIPRYILFSQEADSYQLNHLNSPFHCLLI